MVQHKTLGVSPRAEKYKQQKRHIIKNASPGYFHSLDMDMLQEFYRNLEGLPRKEFSSTEQLGYTLVRVIINVTKLTDNVTKWLTASVI